MEDGSLLPIVRRSLRRVSSNLVPLLPPLQDSAPPKESPKLRVARPVAIPSESQVMIDVTAAPRRLRVGQPLKSLFEKYQLDLANGLVPISK